MRAGRAPSPPLAGAPTPARSEIDLSGAGGPLSASAAACGLACGAICASARACLMFVSPPTQAPGNGDNLAGNAPRRPRWWPLASGSARLSRLRLRCRARAIAAGALGRWLYWARSARRPWAGPRGFCGALGLALAALAALLSSPWARRAAFRLGLSAAGAASLVGRAGRALCARLPRFARHAPSARFGARFAPGFRRRRGGLLDPTREKNKKKRNYPLSVQIGTFGISSMMIGRFAIFIAANSAPLRSKRSIA